MFTLIIGIILCVISGIIQKDPITSRGFAGFVLHSGGSICIYHYLFITNLLM
jgi:hypothetical protein